MSFEDLVKKSIYGDFKNFGIVILVLIPIRIIAGIDLIEVYMDLILIGISIAIFYIFYEINKIVANKKILLFPLNLILAHIIYFVANIMDKYILNSSISELIGFLNTLVIFLFTMTAYIIHIYGWTIFRNYFGKNNKILPKNYEENIIGGSQNIILAIGLRIAISILSLFLNIPYADIFFIISMLILLLIIGSILLYVIGYIRLSSFRKIDRNKSY
ncbi:MAG: hypothetical protein EU550_03390 [Promethearchaeota archaeon]|nr:MAG: hypothetical protein EU550_03390 [Candidatus Lokiarchaeota archaeon]